MGGLLACGNANANANASSSSKPTKKADGKTAKGKKSMGRRAKGKGAALPEDAHHCFHCQSEGAKMRCSQCHRAWSASLSTAAYATKNAPPRPKARRMRF